jgi:hypothetical protein
VSDPTACGSDPAPPKDIRGSSSSSDRSQWFPVGRRCSRALPMAAMTGSGSGSTRGSISSASTPRWKDATPAHLVDIAVFCDSDDTHTASISYFAYVRLERR